MIVSTWNEKLESVVVETPKELPKTGGSYEASIASALFVGLLFVVVYAGVYFWRK